MEAKNSYFKRIAMIGNFKNVAFSVAKRHQRLMCSYVNGSDFFRTKATIGPGIVFKLLLFSRHYWFRILGSILKHFGEANGIWSSISDSVWVRGGVMEVQLHGDSVG
jgi:hypothetical protein